MDAQGVVVGGLFPDGGIGAGGGGLFEGHAGLVLVGHLQVGHTHVQPGVLRQGVVGRGDVAQQFGHAAIDSAVVARQAVHVLGVAPGLLVAEAARIGCEAVHGLLVAARVVVGGTFDAVHLGCVGGIGMGRQVVLRYNLGLVVLLLQQVDLGDVVGGQRFVFGVAL